MLLQQLGLQFVQCKPDLDESRQALESPVDYVTRLSREKAVAVASTELATALAPAVILAADTIVVLDGKLLGKPRSQEEGVAMLQSLSGREHRVLTGVTIQDKTRVSSFHVETGVQFRAIALAEILDYWKTGEPQDKAGGYGIQGEGGRFVTAVKGSSTNVAGLPLEETASALATFGIEATDIDVTDIVVTDIEATDIVATDIVA